MNKIKCTYLLMYFVMSQRATVHLSNFSDHTPAGCWLPFTHVLLYGPHPTTWTAQQSVSFNGEVANSRLSALFVGWRNQHAVQSHNAPTGMNIRAQNLINLALICAKLTLLFLGSP